MPKDYEKMRDKFKADGMSDKAAKGKAARIHNARFPESPVGRYTADQADSEKGDQSRHAPSKD